MAENRSSLNTNSAGASFGFGGDLPSGSFNSQKFSSLTAADYVSLYDLANKEDNRDMLVKTFGAQGITGFLQMVGAIKANGTADEVQYWEETRLHRTIKLSSNSSVSSNVTTFTVSSAGENIARANDIILCPNGERGVVVKANKTTTTFEVVSLTTSDLTQVASGKELIIIGNLYAQGSEQPTEFMESGLVKRTNKYNIIKEVYKVSGSQATNIGWININGQYRWYMKSESDTRQRFMDKREMMMILGQDPASTKDTSDAAAFDFDQRDLDGGEGYFAAIEDRGIVASDLLASMSDIDDMVKVLDKEGGVSEYAMYINRAQDLQLDDIIATGVGSNVTTGAAAFGSFGNDADKAIALGFRSFNRGGYTFHKHDWKLLNDPTLLADSAFAGVCVPMTTVVDPKTGERAPALEMNYKNVNGYSREMEHWMIGSVMGATNATEDSVAFHYRSECNLITRAANQHVLIKSA